jgi:hypothetical protein
LLEGLIIEHPRRTAVIEKKGWDGPFPSGLYSTPPSVMGPLVNDTISFADGRGSPAKDDSDIMKDSHAQTTRPGQRFAAELQNTPMLPEVSDQLRGNHRARRKPAAPEKPATRDLPGCLSRHLYWPEPAWAGVTTSFLYAWRMLLKLWRAATNMVPRCLGTDEYMHFDLDSWVTIDTAKRKPMNFSLPQTAQRGATAAAEADRPSVTRIRSRQRTPAGCPIDPATRRKLGICGRRTAERLSASGAMAGPAILQGASQFIANPGTEATTCEHDTLYPVKLDACDSGGQAAGASGAF